MTPAEKMTRLGAQAKIAARAMTRATPEAKIQALLGLAELLREREADILAANIRDVEAARAAGQDSARLDRLTLTPAIMDEMRAACIHVANLPDPVGATESQWQRPNGLLVGKMRIPLGVIAMIYEARPNVTIDAAILCIKAGNAVILRGGSEALHSNTALAKTLQDAMVQAGLPGEAAQLVTVPGHEAVNALCKLDQYIDVIIPRGGENLVRAVTEAATMPVLKHFKGVCHAYIEPDADLGKALDI
ncbi:MAG: glutamate-5-semialdehyde dehydrogenase, partial [Desulfovibrio sp.]|nr:glutamate-5-semialdehyde dehydrogenase [Desulfovibrio sp.]